MNSNPHDFDAAMRQRHADAVARVSPRVEAQLQLRRRDALAGRAAATRASILSRFGWAGAASFAALLAVAVGLRYGMPGTLPGSMASPDQAVASSAVSAPAMSVASTATNDDADENAGAMLDDNPDFYLWLASADAKTFAME